MRVVDGTRGGICSGGKVKASGDGDGDGSDLLLVPKHDLR